MHIELTEMLRCPEAHELNVLVLSTGEMLGRMVRSGVVGCPVCRREYRIVDGIVEFGGRGKGEGGAGADIGSADAQTIQALLELSGPGGFVVLVGTAARHAVGLASLMGGVHFVGVNAPAGIEELPVLSLLRAGGSIPLRPSMARGIVVGADAVGEPWLEQAASVLLRGRRFVVEADDVSPPSGITKLAAGQGLWVGEKG